MKILIPACLYVCLIFGLIAITLQLIELFEYIQANNIQRSNNLSLMLKIAYSIGYVVLVFYLIKQNPFE